MRANLHCISFLVIICVLFIHGYYCKWRCDTGEGGSFNWPLPCVMYGCESWITKKAQCQRIDAFEMWCWRRLLRVPWTAKRSNQSILKEISPEHSLEGLMLKLELLILWPPDVKNWLVWKDPEVWERLKVGGKGDDRGWDGWMASLTRCTWVWISSGSWWWTSKLGVLQSMGLQRVGHDWATELTNWMTFRHSLVA